MFSRLLQFELKKLVTSPKSLIVAALLLVGVLGYLGYNTYMDSKFIDDRAETYRREQGVIYHELYNISNMVRRGSEFEDGELDAILNVLNRDHTYTTGQRVYATWNNGDGSKWREELLSTVWKEKNLIKQYNNIFLPKLYKEKYPDFHAIATSLNRNLYIYDNGMKPIFSPYDASGWQFMYKLLTVVFPLAAPIAILLICADTLASESAAGSFKFLLLQPVSRVKVFLAKVLASALASVALIALCFVLAFGAACVINGPGDYRYPMEWVKATNEEVQEYADSLDLAFILNDNLEGYETELISGYVNVSKYVALALPSVTLMMVFLSVFGLFISSITKTGVNAITAAICAAMSYIPLEAILPDGVYRYIPFSFADVNSIMLRTGGRDLWYLGACAAALLVAGVLIFRRKDIAC